MRLAGTGQPDLPAAEGIVIASVLELLADASADLQPVLRRNGDVTAIEERVQVGAKQQAVRDLVLAAVGVRTDVRRLEDGQRPLAGDGASALIRVGHEDPERALAETRADGDRSAEATGRRRLGDAAPTQPIHHGLPDPPAFARRQFLGASALGVRMPVARLSNPVTLGKECRFAKYDAADLVVEPGLVLPLASSAVRLDPCTHRLFRGGAVLYLEGRPRQTRWEDGEVDEEADARDRIVRGLQPEEERLTGGQRPKGATARAPEVDFVEIRAAR